MVPPCFIESQYTIVPPCFIDSHSTQWFLLVLLTVTVHNGSSAGSILDISKYRDTCERSISILDGIAILRYIE